MDPTAQPSQSNTSPTRSQPRPGGISKEVEVGAPTSEAPGLKEIGKEIELPPEVAGAGVKVGPTTVTLPPKASQMGVVPAGQKVPAAQTVALPLTDDQIAQGLKQSILSSWRWLAIWCMRKLKQLHRKITMTKSQ